MSINSSNTSLPALRPFFLHYFEMQTCFYSMVGGGSIIVYTAVNTLLIFPLFIFVIYLGLRRWWQRRKMNHSDVLTIHTIVAELIGILGSTIFCCGSLTGKEGLMLTGIYCSIASHFIVTSLHVLHCVDKYLAVVYPIIYVGLRREKGIRIRNASISFIWLLASAETVISFHIEQYISIYTSTIVTVNLFIVSFCSCSVLHVLFQPRPGSRQVDALKLRAFYTICAVLGVLLLRFGFIICATIILSMSIDEHTGCVLWMSSFWFSLPSRFVSPLFFIHREGKMCCRSKTSGQWYLQEQELHLHNNATSLTQTNLNTLDLDPLGHRERRMKGNHKT